MGLAIHLGAPLSNYLSIFASRSLLLLHSYHESCFGASAICHCLHDHGRDDEPLPSPLECALLARATAAGFSRSCHLGVSAIFEKGPRCSDEVSHHRRCAGSRSGGGDSQQAWLLKTKCPDLSHWCLCLRQSTSFPSCSFACCSQQTWQCGP